MSTAGRSSKGNVRGRGVAFRSGSGREAPAFLDTEALTQRGKAEDRHNSTAKRFRILTPRSEWLADVEGATRVVRERKARELEARGRAKARSRLWEPGVQRVEGSGRPESGARSVGEDSINWTAIEQAGPLHQRARRKALRELDSEDAERELGNDARRRYPFLHASAANRMQAWATSELDTGTNAARCARWHSSRAKTKREIFERVETCGTSEGTKVTLVCRDCKSSSQIEVGCGSKWFCPTCRTRQVIKFRKDFNRKRLGLVTAATRAGLTRRKQKKSERWGERLVTFTLPHRGTAQERIEVLRATWLRFWRLLRDRLRPTLQTSSGISFDVVAHNLPNGRSVEDPEHMKLLDLLTYLLVFEWTPGKDDGKGHPHLHVWMFSRYLDNKELLHPLWTRAYYEVRRAAVPCGPIEEIPLLVPDVRAADHDVDRELIKYLTKDWEVSEQGAKRAEPEVFAQVYACLDGKRLKQSSAGFAKWGVEQAKICPCCGYENERGHWARVELTHHLEDQKEFIGMYVPHGRYFDGVRYVHPPPGGEAEYQVRAEHDAQRDSEWSESIELVMLRARVRKAFDASGV